MAARPSAAQPIKGYSAGRLCPNCTDSLEVDAVICVRCGFNTVTGELSPTTARPAIEDVVDEVDRDPAPLTRRDVISSDGGHWLLGFALSLLGAMIGGAVWYMIGVSTSAESPWIGILTGGLSGAGAAVAAKGRSLSLRVVSAGLAIGAIVAARYFLFEMRSHRPYIMPDGYRYVRFGDFFSGTDVIWIALTFCAAMGASGLGRRRWR